MKLTHGGKSLKNYYYYFFHTAALKIKWIGLYHCQIRNPESLQALNLERVYLSSRTGLPFNSLSIQISTTVVSFVFGAVTWALSKQHLFLKPTVTLVWGFLAYKYQ